MSEIKFDWAWVSRELAAAGSPGGTPSNEAVVDLLSLLTKHDLTDQDKDFVVTSFATLTRGHALPRLHEELERWKPCLPGDYRVGDTVRVRSSAYHGEQGMWHNGQRGKIIATRNNSVIVRYDGTTAEEARYHAPNALEVLVP